MAQLFLVRHGPTHAKGMIGWSDLPADLSDSAALARLDRFLPPSATLVSSDLSRTIVTADAIQANRVRLTHKSTLRELNFGDWEQKTWADVAATEPELIRNYYEKPGDIAPPNGESWNTLCARVNAEIDALLTSHPCLIVVCHFGVILSQLQRATGKTAYEIFAQKIDNLSVSQISYSAERWQVGEINHCP